MPPEPLTSDPLTATDIDVINKNSPFQPAFYRFDSAEIDAAAQKVLNTNAEILRKYPTWVITIEGHSDERGTAEYNLALGERRAAARTYSCRWHSSRSAEDRELRQGVPVRSRSRRVGLGDESSSALRRDVEVKAGFSGWPG
jgi:peptidoglycan-associated lipoprotein